MFKRTALFTLFIVLVLLVLQPWTLAVGQAHTYLYGSIHSHSEYSDGNMAADPAFHTAKACFQFAKSSSNINFWGISEHNHATAGLAKANYYKGKLEADSVNQDGLFTTLYGIEFGTISAGGHVVVYGLDSLLGWETGNYDVYNDKTDYTGLFQKIVNKPGAFGYLAHMNTTDYDSILFRPYSVIADSALVGIAMRNGPAFSTNTTYSDPSTSTFNARLQDMLKKGYHVAPGIDHDNHYITFGRSEQGRTVIIADTLTRAGVMKAFRQRRFYASDDNNARVTFTVDGNQMGCIAKGSSNPLINVTVTDPDIEAVTTIKIWYGIPGSGTLATSLTSVSGSSTLSYTHVSPVSSTYYYYAEITQADGQKIWTAPVWYTHTSTLPVRLLSFTGENNNGFAALQWTTTNEWDFSHFEVEKSVASDFKVIGRVAFSGETAGSISTYAFSDPEPLSAVTYYRLAMVDFNGSIEFSPVIALQAKARPFEVSIYPNPAGPGTTWLQLHNDAEEEVLLTVYNTTGQQLLSSVFQTTIGSSAIELSTRNWLPGMYIVHLTTLNHTRSVSAKLLVH